MFAAPVQVRSAAKQVASWGGTEPWLGFREFSNMLHSPPYSVLLNCDGWQARPGLRLTLIF